MPPRKGSSEPQTLTELHQGSLEVPSLEIAAALPGKEERTVPLALVPVVVGKDPEADLVIDDPRVSRNHCTLTLTERGIVLRDLGSKNGTFAAGVRVVEAILSPGIEFTVGSARLSVRVSGSPSAIPLHASPRFGDALGASVVMRALFAQLDRVAKAPETVLMLGESGTGKELLARAVHERSSHAKGPFVVFDCGAVTPNLVESELFGSLRGAFTGAVSDRAGVLEQAEGGTLFLDEIGELPLTLQPKLLRAIEARQYRPLGSNAWRTFDTRILAATHRDVRSQVAAGTFREDLYFRIAVVEVHVPALRERRDDIGLLVESFLQSQTPPKKLADLPDNTLSMLKAHDWPGNVRELRNTVARLLLFPHLGAKVFDSLVSAPGKLPFQLPLREARELVVEDFEQAYLAAKLRAHKGNVSTTAEAMGVSRQFVHRLMVRYGIRGSGR
jgi:transcriptional regulator with PAS, ATPase and Fis domain